MAEPEATFSPGDKVRRNDGGPTMTVVDVYDRIFHYRFKYVWMAGEQKRSELFRAEELEAVPDEPKT